MAVHLLLVGLFLAKYDGNPQWFVHFGKEGSVLPLARQLFGRDLLIPHEDGHDGQAFWLVARDPLLLDAEEMAPLFDRPGYRAQRIAYPALAAPWRVFGETALLWALLLTNLVVVFVGGYVATLLALQVGAPARAALAFALNPATFVAVIMDGSDALALAALLATLLLLLRRRPGWAVGAAVLATLAKEPAFLGVAAVATLTPRLSVRTRAMLFGVPAVAAATWAVYARWRLGWPPGGVQEFAAPFWGWIEAYRRGWRPVGNWADAVVAVALVPFAAAVIVRWWRRRNLLLSAALPYAAMVPFLSAQVVDLAVNSLRAFGPALCLLWMDWYVRDPRSTPRPARHDPAAPPATRR